MSNQEEAGIVSTSDNMYFDTYQLAKRNKYDFRRRVFRKII